MFVGAGPDVLVVVDPGLDVVGPVEDDVVLGAGEDEQPAAAAANSAVTTAPSRCRLGGRAVGWGLDIVP